MLKKILIANRSDVALRIIRTCREMGIATVAVHSVADEDSMHVRLADESVCIGPAPSRESYLNIPAILTAALITGADAIHPGIGFLAENEQFAQMVEAHGLVFIGPTPEHIRVMGDKVMAKKTAIETGIPTVPGSKGAVDTLEDAQKNAKEIGYPVLIKAAAGGGGKGMKVAETAADLEEAFRFARSEAKAAFGNDQVYMEKFLKDPKHIEVQILADSHGNVVHLGERECSVQRKHQKVVEEAPSPVITAKQRADIGKRAVDACKAIGYRGVGTMEFLYENGEFYFIEMNTRLQIEHTITEMITGVDLVREQIKVASGLPLSFKQDDIRFEGHAIECRINAENPETFFPSPGVLKNYHTPGGLGVRVDSALYSGYRIPPHYDSMIAKLITHASNREDAIHKMTRSLSEFVIEGVETIIPLHQRILHHPEFLSGEYTIKWLEKMLSETALAKSA
ncbi:MAG: acetyl-CoA carboxylase biotin carboxylase subunit [Alphaproteobacteria bacterium]|nr:acetyl-CoA carboxylase biotin carboxylase subunit [Alphaproteobacteria bacterium]